MPGIEYGEKLCECFRLSWFVILYPKEVISVLAVAGYYDGKNVQLFEKAPIKKNQRLIITVMDDFVADDAKESSNFSEKKRAAFERLETWREKNKVCFDENLIEKMK